MVPEFLDWETWRTRFFPEVGGERAAVLETAWKVALAVAVQSPMPAISSSSLPGTGAETLAVPLRAGMRHPSTETQCPVTLQGTVWAC